MYRVDGGTIWNRFHKLSEESRIALIAAPYGFRERVLKAGIKTRQDKARDPSLNTVQSIGGWTHNRLINEGPAAHEFSYRGSVFLHKSPVKGGDSSIRVMRAHKSRRLLYK